MDNSLRSSDLNCLNETIKKVSGEARYTVDIKLPNMLTGKLLYAKFPRARIKSIDISGAVSMVGVVAVVTHQDLPKEKFFGRFVKDQPIFVINEVCHIGDIIAAVAAEDEKIADVAVQAIKVEYSVLPGIFDVSEAIKPDALSARSDLETNILAHVSINHGNIESGFAEADALVEKTYKTSTVDQAFMECEGTVAAFDGEILTIYAGGQHPYRDWLHISEALGLPTNRVKIIYPYIGGAFGGKDELHTQLQTAILAMKCGRPVKLICSRSESFITHPKRNPLVVRYKTGAHADGTISAIEVEALLDSGPYSNASPGIAHFLTSMACGPYKIPNAKIDTYVVATNNLPGGAMRGFGGPEIAFGQEQNIDLLAKQLNIDPLRFRLMNGVEENIEMPNGVTFGYKVGFRDTIIQAAKVSNWYERRKKLDRMPQPNLRRGLGVASVWHGVGFGKYDFADITVEMAPDGSVQILSGTAGIGPGSREVQAIIASRELGVNIKDIQISFPQPGVTGDAGSQTASRQVYMAGNAVLDACRCIRKSLLAQAADEIKQDINALDIRDGYVYIKTDPPRQVLKLSDLAKIAWSHNKSLRAEGRSGYGLFRDSVNDEEQKRSEIYLFATQIAQVLVDIETGQVIVEKIWAAHDVGKTISPLGVKGQIHGGVIQGLGYALMEELKLDYGQLQSQSLATFLIPTAADIPEVVPIVVEVPEPTGPYGAKGLGEPTLTPVAPAIANAIADAVGIRTFQIPMTSERIWNSLNK
jgi:CO/xanthine dehydrogenase Mo-binding subunit